MESTSNAMISVIVVTAGSEEYIFNCLDSIESQSKKPSEVILIDNCLNPLFSLKIKQSYPRVKVHSGYRDLSYCAALNLGISMSTGEFLLCLNDDVELDRCFLEEGLKAFCELQRIGMVSGKILRFDKKTIDSTGLFLTVFRTARERGYSSEDRGQFENKGFIFGSCGAAAFYRRKMLDDIKEESFFDEDFRYFYEDLDIAWRARRKGWKAFYTPSAVCFHARGGTARQPRGLNKPFARSYLSDALLADLIKNRYLAIIKNDSLPGIIFHLPAVLLYDLVAWGWCVIFRVKALKEVLSGLSCLKKAIKKRFLC